MTKSTTCKKLEISDPDSNKAEEDYVFRFKLQPRKKPLAPDTVLADFFRDQLRDLFKVIFLSRNGEKIIPTEFGFLNDQDKKYPL